MPPPLGAGGIMFSGCPSVRPSEAWNTLFWPVHGSVGPPDQPWPFYGMSVRPSVRPPVRPSVRPSEEVSGHLPENAWRKWPAILHADVSWPSSALFSLWPRSVDFFKFWYYFHLVKRVKFGAWAFPWERMEEMALNFARWCILTTFRTD